MSKLKALQMPIHACTHQPLTMDQMTETSIIAEIKLQAVTLPITRYNCIETSVPCLTITFPVANYKNEKERKT